MLHIHGAGLHFVAWRGDLDANLEAEARKIESRSASSMSKKRPKTPIDKRRQELFGDYTLWDHIKDIIGRSLRSLHGQVNRPFTPPPTPPMSPDSERSDDLLDMPEFAFYFDEMVFDSRLTHIPVVAPAPQLSSRWSMDSMDERLLKPKRIKLRDRVRPSLRQPLEVIREVRTPTNMMERPYTLF